MFKEQFSNCPLKFILEDDELYINYNPDDSVMVHDFLVGLDEKQEKKLSGVLMMQVMIDTANNVCCVSYTNQTSLNDKKLDVLNRLKNMQGWERKQDVLPETNICALVSIIFNKTQIKVIRTGYNRNRGRKIVRSVIFDRYYIEPVVSKDRYDTIPHFNDSVNISVPQKIDSLSK
jgi:hypothetical protein